MNKEEDKITSVDIMDNGDDIVKGEKVNNGKFFNHLQQTAFEWILILLLILVVINILLNGFNVKFPNNSQLFADFIMDIKGILIGTIVGLIFSMILAISSIKAYLLQSAANFMAGDEYLKKLSPNVLKSLRNKVYNIIYDIDMTSNEQSLFNYIKQIEDKLINTPHKSSTDELLVYKFFTDDEKIFKVKRTQNFRIHTLNLKEHNKFPLNTQMITNLPDSITSDLFKEHFKFVLKINNKLIHSINTKDEFENIINSKSDLSNDLKIKYSDNEGLLRLNIKKEVLLEKDFTDIEIITERLEPNEGSFALLANEASYIYEAKFILPEKMMITNLYHDRTIYTSNNTDLKMDGTIDNNIATFVNKSWQLPGLIVTLTFK